MIRVVHVLEDLHGGKPASQNRSVLSSCVIISTPATCSSLPLKWTKNLVSGQILFNSFLNKWRKTNSEAVNCCWLGG